LIPRSIAMKGVGMKFDDKSVTYMCVKTDGVFAEWLRCGNF
jgi:hypothetical protein